MVLLYDGHERRKGRLFVYESKLYHTLNMDIFFTCLPTIPNTHLVVGPTFGSPSQQPNR